MSRIFIDYTKDTGKIKPMHAVNNGPVRAGVTQTRENFNAWCDCGIPYARNHDASINYGYGGEHIVDVIAIFPDFDADVNDPASYDFHLTDEYLKTTLDAGTKIFYRLGNKIEHWSKKYGTLPPKDYKKWAQICEHIIMHYNEGWADGHNWDIEYWEIWNEPDLRMDHKVHKETWGGTKADFFDFFEVAAKYLKNRFPNLKIGGPAACGNGTWCDDFLEEMSKRNVPLDFFSWHLYHTDPKVFAEKEEWLKGALLKNGYTNTETNCNEWNYIKGWEDDFVYSLRTISSLKAAAFSAAVMMVGQNTTLDMMMYYDARPSEFNGLFDIISYEPIKGYYTFKMFNELYKLGTSYEVKVDCEDVYCVAAKNGNDEAVMISFYNDNDNDASVKTIDLDINGKAEYDIYLLDEEHNMEKVGEYKKGTPLKIKHNTVILFK